MVKIRLQRVGTKKRPFYRIVAVDSRMKRDGKILENLGQYHPLMPEDQKLNVKLDRVEHWLKNGAQPTPVMERLLKKAGHDTGGSSAS